MNAQEDNDYYYTYRIVAVRQGSEMPFLLIKLIHTPGGIHNDPRVHKWMSEVEVIKFSIFMQRRGFTLLRDEISLAGEVAAFI